MIEQLRQDIDSNNNKVMYDACNFAQYEVRTEIVPREHIDSEIAELIKHFRAEVRLGTHTYYINTLHKDIIERKDSNGLTEARIRVQLFPNINTSNDNSNTERNN